MAKVIAFTGGSGLLAVNMSLLLAHDYDIILILHNRNIQLPNIKTVFVDLGSVTEISDFLQQFNVDILVNCAALTDVDACEKNPDIAMFVNASIANNAAIACFTNGVKLVHISTDHLFDGKSLLYSEESPVRPLNCYGYSKAVAEEKVLTSCPQSLILRTNFFGGGLPYRKSFSDVIIHNLTNEFISNLFVDVYYTPVIISKLVFAASMLLSMNCSGIFHISSGERISKYDFGYRLAQLLGYSPDLIKESCFSLRSDLTQRPSDMSLSNKKLLATIPSFDDNISNHISLLDELITPFDKSN